MLRYLVSQHFLWNQYEVLEQNIFDRVELFRNMLIAQKLADFDFNVTADG
ncbi:hypothetical protein [Spirosoma jeollabukense]